MRLLWHCEDRVGRSMAGPGIRAYELCRQLARAGLEVTLVAPGEGDLEGDGFAVAPPDRFEAELERAAIFVTQGFGWPLRALFGWKGRLVVDLYDPVQLELLARYGPAPAPRQRLHLAYVRERLGALLRRGDHFLCASERQRALWLGWLGAAGRLTPELWREDPTGRALVAVVPFGTPSEPPASGRALRGVVPGVDAGAKIVLWGGGLWPWLDPLTAVRAGALLSRRLPGARMVFLGGARPGGAEDLAAPARALAAELGALGGAVIFHEGWVPYAARGAYLREADAAVCCHPPHLETEFSFRTRLLDCLWARLPVACTEGDAVSELCAREGMARTVPAGDPEALAEALFQLLQPEENARRRAAAERVAPRFTWENVARPLLDLVRKGGESKRSLIPSAAPEVGGAGALAMALWERAAKKLGKG